MGSEMCIRDSSKATFHINTSGSSITSTAFRFSEAYSPGGTFNAGEPFDFSGTRKANPDGSLNGSANGILNGKANGYLDANN